MPSSSGIIPDQLPRNLPWLVTYLAWRLRQLVVWANLPPSRWRDHLVNYLAFVTVLKRFPRNVPLYNDAFYRNKTGPALRSDLAALVSDKELAKQYIARTVGNDYNVPTLAILKTPEEVDAFAFPHACIIKATHGSGQYMARKDGEPLRLNVVKNWLKLDYYKESFEPNYRSLVPKVIVEPWVFKESDLMEIKVFCVAGKARAFNVLADRFQGRYALVAFDREWNEFEYFNSRTKSKHRKFSRPEHLGEMVAVAERLAANFFFTRIDLYYDGKTIKCGEITNCCDGGLLVHDKPGGEILRSKILFSDAPEVEIRRFFNA